MRAIAKGLPRQSKKDNHFVAMTYDKVAAFMKHLRKRESSSRLALAFAVLTAARSGEVPGATWEEFDLKSDLWPRELRANRAGFEKLKEAYVKARYSKHLPH